MKSIGMEEKTIRKDGSEKKEYRFFISSLEEDIELFSRAVRGHWSVESMHWHLDVTFREDANQTLDHLAAQNLNIIRKWCLSILKVLELFRPNLSMKKKRFIISMNPPEFLEQVLAFFKILPRFPWCPTLSCVSRVFFKKDFTNQEQWGIIYFVLRPQRPAAECGV